MCKAHGLVCVIVSVHFNHLKMSSTYSPTLRIHGLWKQKHFIVRTCVPHYFYQYFQDYVKND